MTKICEDEIGLYAIVGDWIARPTNYSEFKDDDITETYHIPGSSIVGFGKLQGSKYDYIEYWKTDKLLPAAQVSKDKIDAMLKPYYEWRENASVIDIDRMKQALAGPSVMIPNGLTPQEIIDFILNYANKK